MSDILLFLASFILTFLALYLTIHTIVNKKNKRSQEHYTELLVMCKTLQKRQEKLLSEFFAATAVCNYIYTKDKSKKTKELLRLLELWKLSKQE